MKKALSALLACYVLANSQASLSSSQQSAANPAKKTEIAQTEKEFSVPKGFESLDYLLHKKQFNEFIFADISEGKAVFYSNSKPYFFEISSGAGNGTKDMVDDEKTPRGIYYVCGSYPSKEYQLFIRLSYPNIEDANRGLEQGLITKKQYDTIISANKSKGCPPSNTQLGGDIGLHGGMQIELDGEKLLLTTQFNWTKGCIATEPEKISYLYKNVKKGTPVVIVD